MKNFKSWSEAYTWLFESRMSGPPGLIVGGKRYDPAFEGSAWIGYKEVTDVPVS